LPVAAIAYRAPAAGRVFTHWAREEDHELRHGKFDEELQRMSSLVDELRPGDLLLCNETFSSPSEAEGSQILLDVTRALVRSGVRVCSVTHLYDFAESVAADPDLRAVCLRAPRDHAGDRTYRLEPGPPLPTSFGVDLYDRVFGTDLAHHHGNPPAERTERPEAHEEFDHE
jgi:DNA mismatch repair ATPase MutS